MDTANPGAAETAPIPSTQADRTQDRAFRIVLVGLLLLVVGFTATLVSNAFYPCEPPAGSTVQPPISDCALALSPWLGLAAVGLVVAIVGYLRVR